LKVFSFINLQIKIKRKEDVIRRYEKEIAEEKKRRENVLASMVFLIF
jgi:hypothetical protein